MDNLEMNLTAMDWIFSSVLPVKSANAVLANKDLLDLKDHQAPMANPELMANLALQENPAKMLAVMTRSDQCQINAPANQSLDQLDLQDLKALQELLDHQDPTEEMVMLDQMALQDHKDLKDPTERLDLKDPMEMMAQLCQLQLFQLDHQVLQAKMDLKDLQVMPVKPVPLDLMARMVITEIVDLMANQVLLAKMVLLVNQVALDLKDPAITAHQLDWLPAIKLPTIEQRFSTAILISIISLAAADTKLYH